MDPYDFVSASEVGEYVFCKRGWWLRQQGLLPITSQMIRGTALHEKLFNQLLRLGFFKKLAFTCIIVGLVLVISICFIFLFS